MSFLDKQMLLQHNELKVRFVLFDCSFLHPREIVHLLVVLSLTRPIIRLNLELSHMLMVFHIFPIVHILLQVVPLLLQVNVRPSVLNFLICNFFDKLFSFSSEFHPTLVNFVPFSNSCIIEAFTRLSQTLIIVLEHEAIIAINVTTYFLQKADIDEIFVKVQTLQRFVILHGFCENGARCGSHAVFT